MGLCIAFSLAIAGAILGYWSFSISGTARPLQWWSNWLQDIGTEMLGASVTILLVELVIYQRRDKASQTDRERAQRRERLIQKLEDATSQKERQKILDRMKRQNLLQRSWLSEANLYGVDLRGTNLEHADLFEANLATADLEGAALDDAILRKANLRNANLQGTSFVEADLSEADLRDTNLIAAVLNGADLDKAKLSSNTRLPDGVRWHPDMDLSRYTCNGKDNLSGIDLESDTDLELDAQASVC